MLGLNIRKIGLVLFILFLGFGSQSGLAQEQQPNAVRADELYTGETVGSKADLDYRPLDAILNSTVFITGRSNREAAGEINLPTGTRISSINPERTRYEGNRVFFHLITDEQAAAISNFRADLQAIPSWVDLARLSKDAQLAYWLNLYNLTVLEQINNYYPITDIERLRKAGMWDEKIITIRGLPISLNDIQQSILSNWEDPLVLYGLFQGAIGGPNIRKSAFRASNVWSMLRQNAREFINSLRGVQFWGDTAKISLIYEWGADKFPSSGDQKDYIRDHMLRYAEGEVSQRLLEASEIEISVYDHHIADLYNGVLGGTSIANSPAGALGMESVPERGAAEAGGHANVMGDVVSRTGSLSPQALDFLREITIRNRERATNITIQDVESDSERDLDEDDGGD